MLNESSVLNRTHIQIPVFVAGVFAPFAVFYILYITAIDSILIEDLLMHFVLIAIVSSFSFYTAYYYYKLYLESPKTFLLYASISTFIFAVIFSIHGVMMIPGHALFKSENLFEITEHYGLFISVLFLTGLLIPLKEERGFLYKNRKKIYLGVIVILSAIIVGILRSESAISMLGSTVDFIIILTGFISIAIALILSYRFSKTQELLLLYFIFGTAVIASSGYIPSFYIEGSLLWWYSHLTYPIGYTAIFIGLINYKNENLDLGLFFGDISFYKKLGTKFALTIFAAGLLPLLIFGMLMFVSVGGVFSQTILGSIIPQEILVGGSSPLTVLIFRFVLMVSILFVLATFFAFYFAIKLTLPIRELRKAADRIAKGEREVQVKIETGDEIELFADSFNKMATDLNELYTSMEKTIGDRTAELHDEVVSLEQTKKAVLNLLEDSKILEDKLAEEKASVERKVVERTRELKKEQARLLSSINSLSFGFVIADTNDNIIVKNAALSRILDITVEPTSLKEIIGSFNGVASELDVLPHKCRECIELKKVVELKEISHGQKYLRVFCTPVIVNDDKTPEQDGEAIGYVVMVEDITEVKIMERSRDEFFAVASHELRTPLTAIRGNADMILEMYADKIVDKDMKEMLQDIDVSSIRLIAIVNDFLETSRLEQGKFEIKKERFSVVDVVVKVIRDMKSIIENKKLVLNYIMTTPAPLPEVIADKNRTEQVLINLIGNAVKFTKSGGITIELSVVDNFVSIHVKDTGVGISDHNQAMLFRKFQQAGEQMLARDVTQSTGLGLYISRMIVSAMGGTIALEKSELGKGSTFFFTLPVAK